MRSLLFRSSPSIPRLPSAQVRASQLQPQRRCYRATAVRWPDSATKLLVNLLQLVATSNPRGDVVASIHSTAIVHPDAVIGENVEIGPFSIIHGSVEIGSHSKVGAYCELGIPTPLANSGSLRIGQKATIRSHAIFYDSGDFGDGLTTGHRVTVRENTTAGENLQLGTLCDVQGDCKFGDFVRCHSNVHVGKQSKIGNYVWIFPYVVLTNDPTPPSDTLSGVEVEDYAVIATMSVILPGVRVGTHSLVAAGACVGKDVPPQAIAAGVPAKILGATSSIKLRDRPAINAYPWPRHFRRGYPPHVCSQWDVEFGCDTTEG